MGAGKGRSRRAKAAMPAPQRVSLTHGLPVARGIPQKLDGSGGVVLEPYFDLSMHDSGLKQEDMGESVYLTDVLMKGGLLGEEVELTIAPGPNHPHYMEREVEQLRGVLHENEVESLLTGGKTAGLMVGGQRIEDYLDRNWGWVNEVDISIRKLRDEPAPPVKPLERVEF